MTEAVSSQPSALSHQPRRLVFGPITIEWDQAVRRPIDVDHERLNGENAYITECPVTFRRAGLEGAIIVPADFPFDGASIPRRLWRYRGFAPCGRHLWAALAHDWLCEEEKRGNCDRVYADAVFAALLEHTGVAQKQAWLMELGVALYRWLVRLDRRTRRPKQ